MYICCSSAYSQVIIKISKKNIPKFLISTKFSASAPAPVEQHIAKAALVGGFSL
jgi:hypothetical protein